MNKHFITPAPGSYASNNEYKNAWIHISGTYNLDDSAGKSTGPACQANFKSTSKRDAFGYQAALQVSDRKTSIFSFLTEFLTVLVTRTSWLSSLRETYWRTVSTITSVSRSIDDFVKRCRCSLLKTSSLFNYFRACYSTTARCSTSGSRCLWTTWF